MDITPQNSSETKLSLHFLTKAIQDYEKTRKTVTNEVIRSKPESKEFFQAVLEWLYAADRFYEEVKSHYDRLHD